MNCRATAPVAVLRQGQACAPYKSCIASTNIVERYVVCEMRGADSRRHNESDFSAFEFFVKLQCVEDFSPPDGFRQSRG